MKRSERLFAIAELLRGRRTGITAGEIARRFGTTTRTIYRDLDALRDAHFPIVADRGRGGGLGLDRSYALPPISFRPREAAVLLALAEHAINVRLAPFPRALAAATDKVRGALDASTQRELVHELKRLIFVGVPQPPVPPRVLAAVERAWFEQVPLRVTYVDRRMVESERRVRIERVLVDRTETRLAVTDLDKDEPRELRLHGITEATVLATPT